ncbi:MAG: desulfoferrodoxin [archaeon]|jgi:superoxide reductase
MTEKNQVHKCEICGNIIEVVHSSVGVLVCCGQNMTLMTENTTDAAQEKHVPVITKTAEGTIISVGSVEHPMTEEHHIEWIEAFVGNKVLKKYLSSGEKPEMKLCDVEVISARAYCNLHGLWKSE